MCSLFLFIIYLSLWLYLFVLFIYSCFLIFVFTYVVSFCLFVCSFCFFFFFKQKTAYEMRISDWSSDVCSSDLLGLLAAIPDEGLLARLHGIDFRGPLAANALQQLIRTQGFGSLNHRRQQADEQPRQPAAHCAASLTRVLMGSSSQAGACC